MLGNVLFSDIINNFLDINEIYGSFYCVHSNITNKNVSFKFFFTEIDGIKTAIEQLPLSTEWMHVNVHWFFGHCFTWCLQLLVLVIFLYLMKRKGTLRHILFNIVCTNPHKLALFFITGGTVDPFFLSPSHLISK